MNILKKSYCRIFQTVFKLALPILPYREPKILKDENLFKEEIEILEKELKNLVSK